MAEFVPFDPENHMDEFRQMYIEWFYSQMNPLKENYGIDFFSISNMKAERPTKLCGGSTPSEC